jgi:uncharacterized metal-binding protein YceD (DUF177 family)
LKLVNQYIIPFVGLKVGEHEFNFDFSEKFFKKHEVLESPKGRIKAIVHLTKSATILSFAIRLEGELHIQCDRCLDFFKFPIHYRDRFVVKFGENIEDSTDEIWIINPNEHELDLEQYFFECLGLSLPIQRVHPDDADGDSSCNMEMLNILGSHTSRNHEENKTDPRWNALKNLLDKNNNN